MAILLEAVQKSSHLSASLHIKRIASRKGSYLYINATMGLNAEERNAVASVCDNQGLLLVKCTDWETIVIIEP